VREIFYSGEEWAYPDEIERIYHALCDQFDAFIRTDGSLPAAHLQIAK
jgi:hypothetical protein